MKWIRRVLVAIAILACGVLIAAFMTALRSEHPVGFQVARAIDANGQRLLVGVWYPTQARPRPTTLLGPLLMDVAPDGPIAGRDLPLVVISHGNGGGPGSHADLALALADAGYVVAAPMHTGDNYADQSAAGSASLYSGRNQQLHATIDYMLGDWQGHDRIDPERVGAFGMSAGGFTVLTAVGAQPDLRLVAGHCAESPEFICDVLRHAGSPLLQADTPNVVGVFLTDARIKAAAVAAPGLGFSFGPHGLANVQVPIQLWSADQDRNVPYATNARLVREALGPRVEFHAVPGAGHASFLAICGVLKPPGICSDPGQFDRKAFHATMNSSVVAFLDRNLPGQGSLR
ncbi:MAG: prolyl oligopeptidase family serine peptidase [Proteobacteria bacterium]|nr:prolyl oligopeptidase family serine peptidase [Pseudomonadota bacterium]